MTAFAINSGGTEYYDQKSGASTNATLDTWTISAGSTLVVRTDTYACPNHSVAAGSLDNVTSSGVGGVLQFDPTYTRQISYTGGSGNAPAYGTTISQGGVSGVFLGTWADWQSEPTVPGAAIPASGYMKIGGITGGAFSAGALTGIAATCSGADIQSWIEIRGAETGTITVSRVLTVSSVQAWFELGTTNGTAGQIIPCPTTGTVASVWGGAWIETASGSGVYERFAGAGSNITVSTYPTDVRGKVIWQTTSGIRIGNNGTNNVGFLPPTGCKVRIPAVILTNCTRSAGGSGARVLPNATVTTRQEFDTTSGGIISLNGVVCQWYSNFDRTFSILAKNSIFHDRFLVLRCASPLDIDNVISSTTQAQANATTVINYCYAGGNVKNFRATTASSANVAFTTNQNIAVVFDNVWADLLTERATTSVSSIWMARNVDCAFSNCVVVGSYVYHLSGTGTIISNCQYADTLTSGTSTSNQIHAVRVDAATGITVDGVSSLGGIANIHPYLAWVNAGTTSGSIIQNIGTYASPVNCGSANATGYIFLSGGANSNMEIRRCYAVNTRQGRMVTDVTDTGLTIEHVYGDYADTDAITSLNSIVKSCGYTGTTSGQTAVYGTHWLTRFTSTTAGFVEIVCNEPTISSAAQCYVTSGSPKFNSSGQLLMTVSGQQIVWEMNFYALGYTAFTNTLPTITGTNVTSAGNGVWGNHLFEFQINTGSGYGGTWLTLTAANLIAQTITSSTGFKLKIRATCQSSSSTNSLTNIRIAMTTTSTDQSTNLYPLNQYTLTLTGLVTGSDVVILQAGTTTVINSVDANSGSTYSYTYETLQNVDIKIINPGYLFPPITNYPLASSNVSLPVSQTFDRNYLP